MYKIIIGLLLYVLLSAVSCGPRNSGGDVLKKVQDNNMDFPDWESHTFEGVAFSLPEDFGYYYNDNYVMDYLNSQVYSIPEMKLYFGVERFTDDQADEIAYQFEERVDPLDAVHEHYVYKREMSLDGEYQIETSVKKELGKQSLYPGWFQVVHGKAGMYAKRMTYFTATIEVDNEYYVFQWIGKEGNMEYFLDDFNKMIASIS